MSLATTLTADSTEEALASLDSLYEIVNGLRVEKPPMGSFQIIVASLLAEKLAPYTRLQGLGRVVIEMLFKLPGTTQKRRPDVAYVSFDRWAKGRKVNIEDGWDVVPDLAIEVISPSNSADEVNQKIAEYFKAGVRQVWVVYPVSRLAHIFESPKKVTILDINDDLDGGDLLPGFRLSLAELFEDAEDA